MGDDSQKSSTTREKVIELVLADVQDLLDRIEESKRQFLPALEKLEQIAARLQQPAHRDELSPEALENRAQIELRNYVATAINALKQEGFATRRETLQGFTAEIQKCLAKSGDAAFRGAASEFEKQLTEAVRFTKNDLLRVSESLKSDLNEEREARWKARLMAVATAGVLVGVLVGLMIGLLVR